MDRSSGDQRRAIEELLLRGRERTTQLLEVLGCGDWVAAAEDLVAGIQKSFTEALSILDSGGSEEVSQPGLGKHGRPTSGFRRSEDSGESCKSPWKDRRGSYKRRKTTQSWTTKAHTLVDDGHGWRKYGQKSILNTKHPRSYYRCTHKFDQGCLAKKQVQMTEDEPPLYLITYNNYHSCKNPLRIGVDSAAAPASPCGEYSSSTLTTFDSSSTQQLQHDHPFPSPQQLMATTTTDQELPYRELEAMFPCDVNALAGGGYSRQFTALDDYHQYDHIWSLLSSFEASHPGDVISPSTTSTHQDMSMMFGFEDFMDDALAT